MRYVPGGNQPGDIIESARRRCLSVALLDACTRALADETARTRLCFRIASAYAGRALGPGPLDVAGSLELTSLADIIDLVVAEGCFGETSAAPRSLAAITPGRPRLHHDRRASHLQLQRCNDDGRADTTLANVGADLDCTMHLWNVGIDEQRVGWLPTQKGNNMATVVNLASDETLVKEAYARVKGDWAASVWADLDI